MAAKTFYLTNSLNENNWAALSETAQSAATTSSGWTVGTGSTNHSELNSGVERAASTFTGTTVPDGTLDATLKDAFRSPFPLNGSFASGNWEFHFVVRAVSVGDTQDVRIRFRIILADANGGADTEITAAQQQASIVTDVSTSADFDSTLTVNPGAFTCVNKYLFVQIACERTGAGGMTTCDILFRTGSSSSAGTRIITSDFTANGDVVIDHIVAAQTARVWRGLVATTVSILYKFFIDDDFDFKYTKTTDGGQTWGDPVVVVLIGTVVAAGVWYDQWTPGDDSGTLIYMWYFDTTNDDVFFRTLDTNGDTLGTQRVVFAGATFTDGPGRFVNGAKMKGGNLLCAFDCDSGDETGFYRSTDGGVNWTARTNPYEVAGSPTDLVLVAPAGTTADTNDAWLGYMDGSASEVTIKEYDDSGNSFTEGPDSTIVVANTTDGTYQYPFSFTISKTTGYGYLAKNREYDTANGDFHVYEVRAIGAGNIELKAFVADNVDDCYYSGLFIDLLTDDLYAVYIGKNDGTEDLGVATHVYYRKSTNHGDSWGSPVQYSGGLGDWRQLWVPLSGPRFMVAWRDASNQTLLTNYANSIAFDYEHTNATHNVSHAVSRASSY